MLMGRPLSSLMLCVKIDKTPFTTIMYDFVQMHWISWTEMERRRESRYKGDNLYQGTQVSRYPGIKVPRYQGDILYQGGKLGGHLSHLSISLG